MTALTRRPLPEPDASIDALSDDERAFAAWHWTGRASGELESTRAFRWIADAARTVGAPADFVALANRAVSDEERHGEICARVAAAYAGTASVTPPVSPPSRLPLRAPDDAPLSVALYIAESCCLSETIGSVTIESTLRAATSPLARTALRELLTDEIQHARMGWAYLASCHRDGVAAHLPALFGTMLDYWKAVAVTTTPDAVVGHGCLPLQRLEALVFLAFDELALPGFDHVGIDTTAARAYLATRRPAALAAL